MKTWRDVRLLMGSMMLLTAGEAAMGQVTFLTINREVHVQDNCMSFLVDRHTSTSTGLFDSSASVLTSSGITEATQNSLVTSTSITATIAMERSSCGSGQSSMFLRFSVPTPQRWRVRWNMDLFGSQLQDHAYLQNVGGGLIINAAQFDSIVLLAPGTYELGFDLLAFLNFSGAIGSGNMEMTFLPEDTSQQLTYQGKLLDGGVPFSGAADVRFTFFDAASNGAQIGSSVLVPAVTVDDGTFAAIITPDVGTFDAMSVHVQVAARTGNGAFIDLGGRQPITATPFAIRSPEALQASSATYATHAITAGSAPSAPSATSASKAMRVAQANHASTADHANTASSVPFSGITSNPWSLSGSALSTASWVGIGKVPTEPLDVLGNIRLNDQSWYLRGTGDNNHGLGWYGASKPFASLTPDGPVLFGYAGGLLGTKVTGERTALAWNSSGQVAIGGTSSAGFTLSVNGLAAKTSGGSWATLSDPKAKKNITPMTGTLDRLMQLHGYEYTYRPEFVASGFALPGRQIGLLASEVQQVFPDWVERGSDGYLRVTERSTTALMVEALRDLRAEKDQTLKELREQVSRLEAAVKAQREAE